MKTIRVTLSNEIDTLKIEVFADLHIGDAHCDTRLIRDRLMSVQYDKDAYIILNGDILNNATKTSVSDCYSEVLMPMEQIQQAVELFDPVKDKILAITTGNHERRTYNKEGIDLMEVFARQIGLYDRFSPASALLFVRFGSCSRRKSADRPMTYTIFVNHGSGGGRKEGAKAIRLADMACIVDADVYIHSHTHMPMVMKQGYYRTCISNSSVTPVTKLFVNTAAALDYGGYGDVQEYKPSSKDTPTIYLDGHKRGMTAKL